MPPRTWTVLLAAPAVAVWHDGVGVRAFVVEGGWLGVGRAEGEGSGFRDLPDPGAAIGFTVLGRGRHNGRRDRRDCCCRVWHVPSSASRFGGRL